MEGIDAHVTAEGETVLTMISDDNFSLIQRNLLLQFTLVEWIRGRWRRALHALRPGPSAAAACW